MSRNPHDPLDDETPSDDIADDIPLNVAEDESGLIDDAESGERGDGAASSTADPVDELKTVLAAELSTDTTQHYLNQIGARPLLTVEEEVRYATACQARQFRGAPEDDRA